MYTMDTTDKTLLTILQKGIPICSRPYKKIAGEIGGITEAEVLRRIRVLQEEKIIRRMTGLFDSGNLGYRSVLCGMRVREEDIGNMSDLLQQFSGITHNYLREHEYNMWFTLISPDLQQMEYVIGRIEESGFTDHVIRLYPEKKYKINANFAVGDTNGKTL